MVALLQQNTKVFFAPKEKVYSPIQRAALAAANDIYATVIYDQNFGLIGLVDGQKPTAANTIGAGNHLTVTGIDSLFAQVMENFKRARYLNNASQTQLAVKDFSNALKAREALMCQLLKAVDRNATVLDAMGSRLDPTADALAACNRGGDFIEPSSLKIKLDFANWSETPVTSTKNLTLASSLLLKAEAEQKSVHVSALVRDGKIEQ